MQAKLVRAGARGRACWRGGALELVARGSARAGCAASAHASPVRRKLVTKVFNALDSAGDQNGFLDINDIKPACAPRTS